MTGATLQEEAVSEGGGFVEMPMAGAAFLARPSGILSANGLRTERPVGIALAAEGPHQGRFRLSVATADGVALALGHFDEAEVVAEWRRLAAAAGLPLMLAHPDGRLETPFPQIGPLALGEIRIRRRRGLPSGRRPRFLVRRKTARLPVRPAIYREREIAGGRGS